jgi:hypothetical protein
MHNAQCAMPNAQCPMPSEGRPDFVHNAVTIAFEHYALTIEHCAFD